MTKKHTTIIFAILTITVSTLACSINFGDGTDQGGQPTQPPVVITHIAPDSPAGQPTEEATDQPPRPTETPTPTLEPTPTSSLHSANYKGISFSFDDAVAGGVMTEDIPAFPEGAGSPTGALPEITRFNFISYALQGTFHEPNIQVFSVSEYETMNEYAKQVTDQLRNILVTRQTQVGSVLPLLPTWNAAQFFAAQIHFLDFQNGSGVAYLSMYGQAAWPVNNESIFYTFQGITSDGAWYISAIFPVSHPLLPETGEVDDFETFANNFEQHIEDMNRMLNEQDPSSFTPDLLLLDTLVETLSVKE